MRIRSRNARVAMAAAAALAMALMLTLAGGCTSESEKPKAAVSRAGAPAPPPLPVGAPNALVTIVVGDLPGLIDSVGALASQVAPGDHAGKIKSRLGARVGDPEMKGFASGSGLVVVLPSSGGRLLFAEVDPKMDDTYRQTAASGNRKVERMGDLLVFAGSDEELASARKDALAYANERLRGAGRPTFEIIVDPAAAVAKFDAQIKGFLGFLPAMMGAAMAQRNQGGTGAAPDPQAITRMIEAEFREFLSIARQIHTLQFTVDFQKQGVRAEGAVVPVKDSNLAAFLGAPVDPYPERLMNLLPGQGAARVGYSLNMKALDAFCQKEVDGLASDMKLSKEEVKAIDEWLTSQLGLTSGGFACEMVLPGKPLVSGSFASDVEDPAKALSAFEGIQNMYKSGPMASLFQAQGQSVTFQFTREARRYKDVTVGEGRFDFKLGSLPEDQQKMLKAIIGDMKVEVAVVGKDLVYTMGDEPVDGLIDAAKAGKNPTAKPLEAQRVFPAGANTYADFGVGAAIQIVSQMVKTMLPPEESAKLEGVAEKTQGAPPITAALYFYPDQTRAGLNVPTELITTLGKAIQEAEAQSPSGS